jgi:hypothetical protein
VLSPVTSWANPVEGQSLCKYGKNTHYTCDVTFKDNECRDNYCDMMTMQHRYAASGDSGGPWFAGNTAYGVHSGYKTLSSSLRDMFTPVSTAFGALEVNLKMT